MESRASQIAERERAIAYMKEHCRGRVFYTKTDHGRGEADYVRVFIAPRADEIIDVSYHVGRAIERTVTDRGITYRGGGYSKGLEAAEDAWMAANGGRPPDQSYWREIH